MLVMFSVLVIFYVFSRILYIYQKSKIIWTNGTNVEFYTFNVLYRKLFSHFKIDLFF